MDIGPERGRKANEARNKVREGGFGAGRPYQSVKIGQKMEGKSVTLLLPAQDPHLMTALLGVLVL